MILNEYDVYSLVSYFKDEDADEMDFMLTKAASELLKALQDTETIVCTAESLTGGMVASSICSISGASKSFHTGIVAYANTTKKQILLVPNELLDTKGAVSPETADIMAYQLVENEYMYVPDVDPRILGISTTGVAGSTSEGKPTGTVYIGLSYKKGDCYTETEVYKLLGIPENMGRNGIRSLVTYAALRLALAYLKKEEEQ